MSGTTNSLEEEDETEKGAADLQVFPNPSTGTVTVQLREADPVQVSTLRLFDGMGKLLLTRTMTGERAELELHQPDGMYTVVVIHGSEEYSARIILKAP
ncbi:MAG TPA: T9SS type A sorting domain-containing protein [Flavobacteriales bacterium]|nr:T9SS type A sorting domain-containing protein [Flavobacteriales bacterium]